MRAVPFVLISSVLWLCPLIGRAQTRASALDSLIKAPLLSVPYGFTGFKIERIAPHDTGAAPSEAAD